MTKPICRNEYGRTDRIVVIASSTGGPGALTFLLQQLPENYRLPILIVQHMPEGFTATLAKRLDELSLVKVKEAEPGEEVLPGTVYIAKAGFHMRVVTSKGEDSNGTDSLTHRIMLSDEAIREGVKPSANYTFESLADSGYDEVVCIVLTGMGTDGTEGILNLSEYKAIRIWLQEKESCVVYGMPGSIAKSGVKHTSLSLSEIADEMIKLQGVREYGC